MHRALLGAAVLCACHPVYYMPVGERYSAMCQTWVGDTVSNLMVKWGAPTMITKLPDGSQLYDFDEINGAALQGWDLQHFTRVQARGGVAWCSTRFVIQPDGRVKTYDWHGNDYTDHNGNTTVGCFTTFVPTGQPATPPPMPDPAGAPMPPPGPAGAPMPPPDPAGAPMPPPGPAGAPMPPSQSPPTAQDPSTEPAGIGAALTERSGVMFVQRVDPGSSADSAGLVAGDVILAVNGTDVRGMTLVAVTSLVRGAAGTTVALTVEHAGQVLTINCQRRTL